MERHYFVKIFEKLLVYVNVLVISINIYYF